MSSWLNIIYIVGSLIISVYLSTLQAITGEVKIIVWVICLIICVSGGYGLLKGKQEEKKKEESQKKETEYQRTLLEKQEMREKGLPAEYVNGLGQNPLLKHHFNNGKKYEKEYRFKEAIEEYEKCLFHPGATQENKVAAQILIGNCYSALSELKQAQINYEKALNLSKDTKDEKERSLAKSAALTNLGLVYTGLGNFKKAIEYHEKSLEIDKSIGDQAGESACYTNLGIAYDGLGDFKKAIEFNEKSLEIAKAIEDKAGESKCYTNLGNAYQSLGDFKKAIEYHEKSLEIDKAIGDQAGESVCYTNLGAAYYGLGDFNKAIEYHEKSLEIDKAIGGNAYCGLGDFKKAIEYFLRAEKLFKETEQIHHLKTVYSNLSLAYEKIGDEKNAEKYRRLANSK
jgi:tetratricopeptide (TPR) repeat protein